MTIKSVNSQRFKIYKPD